MSSLQRATFTNLRHPDPEVLMVRIEGHLGTRQCVVVQSLIDKCREKRKTKVVLELSGLTSLGGQVASLLGGFAGELRRQGHPLCLVGASDVVRSFLRARFEDVEPTFLPDLEGAIALLRGSPSAPGVPEETGSTDRQRIEPATAILMGEAASPAEESPRVGEPIAVPPAEAAAEDDPGGAQLTLAQAEEQLARANDSQERKRVLTGLLFGANLARTCYLFHPRANRFVETDDSSLWFPADGPIIANLRASPTMVPIIDLTEGELGEQESETLSRLNCQAALPFFDGEELVGVLFVRKSQAGSMYEPGEALALDLLVRQLSRGKDSLASAASALHDRRVRKERYRSQTLARVSRELNSIQDEEHLLNVLLVTLIGELGVGNAVYYELDGPALRPRCARGCELDQMPALPSPPSSVLAEWTSGLVTAGVEQGPLGELSQALAQSCLEHAVPLRGKKGTLGLLGLGPSKIEGQREPDEEFLAALLHHAGSAVENARLFQHLQEQTLRVARTIMALLDKRVGAEEDPATELVAYYVGRVAQAMNYPADQMRDLLYGTVLRDIGMIEVSDLVLKSPRRLTPEEWKLVHRHPTTGVEIIRAMDFSDTTCDVVLHHHERFNGEGYPHGLRGTAIPLGARIVAAVESFVAMTRKLPYRAALSREEALELLRENWEMRYDPEAVEALIKLVESERGVVERRTMLALL